MACWYVYVVRTARGSLYTGIATDVRRRLEEHGEGGSRGAKALRGRGPLRLELRRRIGSRHRAQQVEWRLKRLPKRLKERLVRDRPPTRRLLRLLGVPEAAPKP